MARISTYPLDREVQDNDAWIGSDSARNKATKQYTAKAIADYLNTNGRISISAQMVFKYWVLSPGNNNVSVNPGPGEFYGPSDGSPITSINTIQISKTDVSGQDVVVFMNYLVGSHILISEQNEINIFGHFLIDSYTINDPDDDFYTLNLTNIAGNGNLTEFLHYNFAVFTPSALVKDKNYVHPQPVASATWTVQHNLNKFPSVTSVNINNIEMYGEVVFNDLNSLTINFSAAFSGQAFIN